MLLPVKSSVYSGRSDGKRTEQRALHILSAFLLWSALIIAEHFLTDVHLGPLYISYVQNQMGRGERS